MTLKVWRERFFTSELKALKRMAKSHATIDDDTLYENNGTHYFEGYHMNCTHCWVLHHRHEDLNFFSQNVIRNFFLFFRAQVCGRGVAGPSRNCFGQYKLQHLCGCARVHKTLSSSPRNVQVGWARQDNWFVKQNTWTFLKTFSLKIIKHWWAKEEWQLLPVNQWKNNRTQIFIFVHNVLLRCLCSIRKKQQVSKWLKPINLVWTSKSAVVSPQLHTGREG